MIIALFNVYLVILFILVKMKIVPFNLFFIPTGWGATDHIKPSHIIRKLILRQIAILNYVNPF